MDLTLINAAYALEGMKLDGGWIVGPLIVRNPNATGGMFSTSYRVTNENGRIAFMKVVDLVNALGNIDQLQAVINEYVYERDLLLMCGERRLSRVVTAISHGQFNVPGYVLGNVNYIIFELAADDIRIALSASNALDYLVRLEMLHDLAVGLNQLHKQMVAHQDLKPSNFLIFAADDANDTVGKIADLGRAYWEDHPSLHDAFVRPGDVGYAPPEQLYRHEYADRDVRRFAADLYQLGNLAAFIFAGVTINALLSQRLAPVHHWTNWGDSYQSVLPYVTHAFDVSMTDLHGALPEAFAQPLVAMLRYLCDPQAENRGHPRSRALHGRQFSLERTISDIDLLAKRAAVAAGRAK